MAKGIEIDIAANTRDFQRGTKDVEKSLDKVADALDDVSKDADKTGRNIGDEIKDGGKDAERAVDKLEKSFKDVAAASKRETRTAGDAMKRNMKEGADGAGEAITEWGDEAKQNIAETFSSFRGEAEDFAGIAQDTFGGVISALGPLGMAAGAAGALGIGMMMAEFEKSQEEAEEFRQLVADLAAEFIEAGGVGETSLGYIVDKLKELATTTDEGARNLREIYKDAEGSVSGFRRIADAYAGNTKELDKLIEREREHLELLDDQRRDTALTWDKERQAGVVEQAKAQERIVEGLENASEAAQDAKDAEEAWLASNGPLYEARAEQLDALQGELDEAIDGWDDYYDAETGATDPAAYIANMQARMDATANFNDNVQQLASDFGLSHEEIQAILDQGVDFAPMLQSIIDSGMGEEYATQIRSMLDGGQSIIDGTDLNTTVKADADTQTAETQLEDAADDRTADIKADAETKPAQTALDRVANKKYKATITASADLAAADRAITNFVNRRRTAVITVEARDREGKLVP